MLADLAFVAAMSLVVFAGFSAIKQALAPKRLPVKAIERRARPYRARRVARPSSVQAARPPWEQFYV